MTASRTITLPISDWARLEEIRQYRDMPNMVSVLKYCIRAESSIIRLKSERDNSRDVMAPPLEEKWK